MNSVSVYASLGLSRNPFPPTPDAESYFFTPALEEEFAELLHCVAARKGIVLLTGEVGLGKSTLVRRLLSSLDVQHFHSALVFNTFLQGESLLDAILTDFGLPTGGGMAEGLQTLNRFLLQRRADGVTSLLVIDDAQNLTVASLELVRLLCNLETGQEKLLQILLVGQPELESTLAEPDMRQLRSRIVKHARLRGLTPDEVGRYFDFRMNAAGGSGRLTLTREAIRLLHRCTDGNLRQMHLLLDRCLYGLAARRQSRIDPALIHRALADVPELQARVHRGLRAGRGLRGAWRWMLVGAGLGLASVAAMAAWTYWQPDISVGTVQALWSGSQTPATPAAPATPEPVVASTPPVSAPAPAPVPTPAPAPSPRQLCEEKLGVHEGKPVVKESRATDALIQRLNGQEGVCVFQDNEVAWLMWLDSGRAAQIQQAEHTVQAVQSMLRSAGLFDGGVDGLMGPQTRQSLARFQKANALAPTGQPDELTLYLLENQHAAR
ncbi:AAA family ATPase [Hydrogenophaga soli]